MSNKIELKAHKLVADLIDSALSKGWKLSEDEEEEKLIEKEIRNIEVDLRKLTQLTESQYELYLELKEIKRRQNEMKKYHDNLIKKINNDSSPFYDNYPGVYR